MDLQSRPPVVALTLALHNIRTCYVKTGSPHPPDVSRCASASSSVHANVLSFIDEPLPKEGEPIEVPTCFEPLSVGRAAASLHSSLVARALSIATRAVYVFLVLPPALRNFPRLVSRLLAFYYSLQPDAPSGHRLFFTFQVVPLFANDKNDHDTIPSSTLSLLRVAPLPPQVVLSLALALRLEGGSDGACTLYTSFAPTAWSEFDPRHMSGGTALHRESSKDAVARLVELFQVPTSTTIASSSSNNNADADANANAVDDGADPEDLIPFAPCEGSVVGGTFDHLHGGHLALLTVTALVARTRVVIGLSGDPLLQKKALKARIEHWGQRAYAVARWIEAMRLAARPCTDCSQRLQAYLSAPKGDTPLFKMDAQHRAARANCREFDGIGWSLHQAAWAGPAGAGAADSADAAAVAADTADAGVLDVFDGVPFPGRRCPRCRWEGAVLVELLDPYGPAATCNANKVGVLIVSEETRSGGGAVNKERARRLAERLTKIPPETPSYDLRVAREEAHFAPLSVVVITLTGAKTAPSGSTSAVSNAPDGRTARAVDCLVHAAAEACAALAELAADAGSGADSGGSKQSSTAARGSVDAIDSVLSSHETVRLDLKALAAAAFDHAYLAAEPELVPESAQGASEQQPQQKRWWSDTPLGVALWTFLGAFGTGSVTFEAAIEALKAARSDAVAADARAAEESRGKGRKPVADADLGRDIVPIELFKGLSQQGPALTKLRNAALIADVLAFSA
jgi:phosphopantetheine adenylyltransferase